MPGDRHRKVYIFFSRGDIFGLNRCLQFGHRETLSRGHQVDQNAAFKVLLCHRNSHFLYFAEAVAINHLKPPPPETALCQSTPPGGFRLALVAFLHTL